MNRDNNQQRTKTLPRRSAAPTSNPSPKLTLTTHLLPLISPLECGRPPAKDAAFQPEARRRPPPPPPSGCTGLLPNHEVGGRGAGSDERGRARSSGPAAPASLASPVARLLPSYEVGARRADSSPTASRSSASAKAASTSSLASTSQTGVCADNEGADAKEVPSFLIRGRLRSLR
ncbi:hypothetical protein ACQJBY_052391 [Aegilops geniculata]